MSDYLTPGDSEIQTDPEVLKLYVARIMRDAHPGRTAFALGYLVGALDSIAGGEPRDPVEWARKSLTHVGERAAPLADEGMPCG